jgi:hypothetical protein
LLPCLPSRFSIASAPSITPPPPTSITQPFLLVQSCPMRGAVSRVLTCKIGPSLPPLHEDSPLQRRSGQRQGMSRPAQRRLHSCSSLHYKRSSRRTFHGMASSAVSHAKSTIPTLSIAWTASPENWPRRIATWAWTLQTLADPSRL